MSNVIDFLERLGADSALRYATQAQLDRAMYEARMGTEERAALISGDPRSLESLLGASDQVCLIWLPQRQDDREPANKPKERVKAA